MNYCPRCLNEYADDVVVCWPCHKKLVQMPEGPPDTEPQWASLSPIYLAPDEFSALRLKTVLEEAGLFAAVQSAEIPWIAGVIGNMKGYWGRVLVHPADRDQATELVKDYLASIDDN